MPVDRLRAHDHVVHALSVTLVDGGFALDAVPNLLLRMIQEEAWRDRILDRTNERVQFDNFEDFVTTKPLEGLGSSIEQIRNCCRGDVEVLDALDRVLQRPTGRPKETGDNITSSSESRNHRGGTAKSTALRRLRYSRPDLHRKVIDKKMTAHAAMVQAGFRRKTASVPIDDLDALTATLKRLLGRRWRQYQKSVAAAE